MPIPSDARQVPGNKNRVILGSGDVVTRARALTLGAQERGYSSHNAYRNATRTDRARNAGLDKMYRTWRGTEQGQHARRVARQSGIREPQLRNQFKEAWADRPRATKSGVYPGGEDYFDFIEYYGDWPEGDEWVAY